MIAYESGKVKEKSPIHVDYLQVCLELYLGELSEAFNLLECETMNNQLIDPCQPIDEWVDLPTRKRCENYVLKMQRRLDKAVCA